MAFEPFIDSTMSVHTLTYRPEAVFFPRWKVNTAAILRQEQNMRTLYCIYKKKNSDGETRILVGRSH